jgi:MFS transporter, putative metabolite:H+ symporter
VRGRATGWIAACTKAGGLIAQGLSIASLVPSLMSATWLIAIPTLLALALVMAFCKEARGRDLRDLELA